MAKTARRRPTPAIKLSRWKWVGKGPQDRPLSGEMIGRSKAEVAAELTKQNIVIRRISKKGNLGGSGRILVSPTLYAAIPSTLTGCLLIWLMLVSSQVRSIRCLIVLRLIKRK